MNNDRTATGHSASFPPPIEPEPATFWYVLQTNASVRSIGDPDPVIEKRKFAKLGAPPRFGVAFNYQGL